MPIKPENKHLYPKDWKQIRIEILDRDGNKCKFCGLEYGSEGVRDLTGKFWSLEQFMNGEVERHDPDFGVEKPRVKTTFRIVLTIAHLDHDPKNNGEPGNRPNLAALCQKCHLNYDAEHHAKNSKATRIKKSGLLEMFSQSKIAVSKKNFYHTQEEYMEIERKSFEHYYSDGGLWPATVARDENGGGYLLQSAACAWEVWQARAKANQIMSLAAYMELREKIEGIILQRDKYIEDKAGEILELLGVKYQDKKDGD